MPVLADPGFAYAQKNPMDTYRQSADTTLSIMERKQQMRQREQAAAMNQQAQDLQREKWEIEKPLIQAKLNADILSYGFDLTDRKATEELRAKAATAAAELGTKFREVIQISSWDEQNIQLMGLQQEYGWLGRFPRFAPVIKAVDGARGEVAANLLTEQKFDEVRFKLGERMEQIKFREQELNSRATEANQTRVELEEARAELAKWKQQASDAQKALDRASAEKRAQDRKPPTNIFNFGGASSEQLPETPPAVGAPENRPTPSPVTPTVSTSFF
jgi:hypothetical protein